MEATGAGECDVCIPAMVCEEILRGCRMLSPDDTRRTLLGVQASGILLTEIVFRQWRKCSHRASHNREQIMLPACIETYKMLVNSAYSPLNLNN